MWHKNVANKLFNKKFFNRKIICVYGHMTYGASCKTALILYVHMLFYKLNIVIVAPKEQNVEKTLSSNNRWPISYLMLCDIKEIHN